MEKKQAKIKNRELYYKYLFFIGAIYNWMVSIPFLIISLIDTTAIEPLGISFPETLIWLQAFLLVIMVYGIGYFLVGLNIKENRDIVLLGVISKILSFHLFLIYYILGEMSLFPFLVATGDLIFSLLFIEFLINRKKFLNLTI